MNEARERAEVNLKVECRRATAKNFSTMTKSLTGTEKRKLRARAQKLDPMLKLGHAGADESFIRNLDMALTKHGLVKIKFSDFKEQKKTLAPEIAEKTGSELVARVGNVAVFFRAKTTTDDDGD